MDLPLAIHAARETQGRPGDRAVGSDHAGEALPPEALAPLLGTHANRDGCNGCDIEVLNVLTPHYDAERFGVKLVASPRHADAMLCQGPALRSTSVSLRRAYDANAEPEARPRHRLLRRRRRPLVRWLCRARRGGEGAPGRFLRSRLPSPSRGHPSRGSGGAVIAGEEGQPTIPPRAGAPPLPEVWAPRGRGSFRHTVAACGASLPEGEVTGGNFAAVRHGIPRVVTARHDVSVTVAPPN